MFRNKRCCTSGCQWAIFIIGLNQGLSRGGGVAVASFLSNLPNSLTERLQEKTRVAEERLHNFTDNVVHNSLTERLQEGMHNFTEDAEHHVLHMVHMVEQNKLGGNPKAYNNAVLALLVTAVTVSGMIGHAVDVILVPASFRAKGHPRGWAIGIIVCVYAMLLPAIRSVLFSFNIYFNIKKEHGSMGYNLTREPITESMLSVISLLFKTGGQNGAYLIVLYAMVMPAVKLIFLVFGEFWRNSNSEMCRNISFVCVILVQVTSKWASPDMFAYVLLLFLIRSMDHPPYMLSTAKLDVGFQCFTVFCLGSTVSTLAIHRPKLAKQEQHVSRPVTTPLFGSTVSTLTIHRPKPEKQEQRVSRPVTTPLLLQCGGTRGALLLVSFLGTVFAVLLLIGILTPCMGVHVDYHLLIKPKGPVPESLAWMLENAIDNLKLRPWLHAEVSMWQCMAALAQWSFTGEAVSILAFLLLAVFAVAVSVLDMFVLAATTLNLEVPKSSSAVMAVSRVLKHVAMLDVFCMGICVVCLAGQAYRAQGFALSLRSGIFPLIGAECIHYITFYLVSSAAHASEDLDNAARERSSAILSKQYLSLKNEAEE